MEVNNILDSGIFLTKLLEDETYVQPVYELAKSLGFETDTELVNTVLGSIKTVISVSEDYQKLVMDYMKNQQYLQRLEASVPAGSTLERAIKDLEKEYEEQMISSMKGIYKSMLDELEAPGAELDSDMKRRYTALKVILMASGVNLTQIDYINE